MSKKGDKHYTAAEEEFIKNNFNKLTYREIAAHLNRKSTNIYHKCRRMGLLKFEPGERRKMIGSLNGNWKGGYTRSEYITHNASGKLLHRMEMEKFLGRELDKKEMVHHIDGDKHNCKIENLALCNGQSEHRLMHSDLEKVAFQLVKSGLIKFDSDSKKYYIDKNFMR